MIIFIILLTIGIVLVGISIKMAIKADPLCFLLTIIGILFMATSPYFINEQKYVKKPIEKYEIYDITEDSASVKDMINGNARRVHIDSLKQGILLKHL